MAVLTSTHIPLANLGLWPCLDTRRLGDVLQQCTQGKGNCVPLHQTQLETCPLSCCKEEQGIFIGIWKMLDLKITTAKGNHSRFLYQAIILGLALAWALGP